MPHKRGWLVPDDWDGESYQFITLCAPCSTKWTGAVFGAVYELTRARNWDETSGDFLAARDVAREVFYSMANCNDGFQAIADAIALLARNQAAGGFDCGCPGGTGTDYDPPAGQAPTVFGPGEQWATEQDYLDDKCHIANLMVEGYRQMWLDLDNLDIDTLTAGVASLGIGIVASVIAGIFATGPIGVTIGVVAGLVSLFVGAPLFDLTDIIATIDANKQDLVCALYNANDATQAKTDFEAVLDTGPLTSLETTAIGLVGVNNFYNQLFEPQEGYETQPVTNPVDCANCFPCELFFAVTGTIDSEAPTQVVLTAADNGSGTTGRVELWFNTDGSAAPNRSICGPAVTFQSVSINSGVAGIILYDDLQNVIGNFHTDPANGNLPQVTANVRHMDIAFNSGQGIGSVCTVDIS